MMTNSINIMDDESRKGRFGWFSVDSVLVPYIHRGWDDTRYCSVRVVDRLVMTRTVELLPQQVLDCALVEAELMTDPEIKLYNDINSKHMDYSLGKHLFNSRDRIVTVDSLLHFLKFLTTCVKMLSTKETLSSPVCDWCGFLRMEVEGEVSDLPYVILDQKKYVPLFYLEPVTTGALRKKAVTISGWDFSYLVFLTCVAGVRQELMQLPTCGKVVPLSLVLLSLPSSTTVSEYWPHHIELPRPPTNTRPGSQVCVTWTKLTPMTKCPPPWLGKLIAIKDFPLDPLHTVSGGDYKLVTARLPGQMELEAVNIRPGVTSPDLMVCLQDLARALSPSMEMQQVYTVLIALGVCLYTPNIGQTKVLETHGKCQDIKPPPTVLVRDLLKHIHTLLKMVTCRDKGEEGL